MYSHGVRLAGVMKVLAGHGKGQYRSVFCPFLIAFHQNAEHLGKILFVVPGGHEISPRLVIEAGRGPAGGFEKAGENGWFDGSAGKSSRAPATADQFVYGVFRYCSFVHVLSLSSRALIRCYSHARRSISRL